MQPDETKTMVFPVFQPGRTVSHYRLIEVLGQGGMGTVWKAEDTRLKRMIALKVITRSGEVSAEANLRFQIEAQAAAALDHPSVCTVYEIDHDEGVWFLAMAFIEGDSLSRKIRSGPLPIDFSVEIARQVADGLSAAHSRNIVHRDIKSSNIMVTPQNTAKILDFGLARVGWTPGATAVGVVLGTPSYMSPEQARGLQLDHRTDVWSLGVVLYEMLAGKLPFRADYSEALLRAIITAPPAGLTEVRQEIPSELARIVYKALAKSPADRFQTASELRDALASLSGRPPAPATGSSSSFVRARPAAGLSLAVLPFLNLTSDPENEYLSDGLADELITALSRIKGLRVVSRTSAFAMKGRTENIQEIGSLLRVGSVLEGSVRKAGNRLRINVQLVHVEDGFPLWTDRYEEVMDDIFRVQEEIAVKVVGALKLTLLESQENLFARRKPANMEVYKLYLQGQFFIHQLNPASLNKAKDYFEPALQLDPSYAPAHAGLARFLTKVAFFGMVPPIDILRAARAEATKALELDDHQAEAHAMLGEAVLLLDWDWAAAENYFREAIRLAPGDTSIRHPYSMLLLRQGRFDEAWLQIKNALDADPLSLILNNAQAFLYFYARRYEEAVEACRKILDVNPTYVQTLSNVALAYSALGRHEEAVASLDQSRRLTQNHSLTVGFYAYACGVAGRREEALKLVEELAARAASSYVPPSSFAAAYIGLGDTEHAFEYLNRACDLRDPTVLFLGVMPVFDSLRSSSRFPELLSRIGLPPTFHPSTLHMIADSVLPES